MKDSTAMGLKEYGARRERGYAMNVLTSYTLVQRTRAGWLIPFCVCFCVIGCAGKPAADVRSDESQMTRPNSDRVTNSNTGVRLDGQDTPALMLRKMYAAAMASDKKRFLECFYMPKKYPAYLDAGVRDRHARFLDDCFTVMVKRFAFKKALQKVYGADGILRFESPVGEYGMGIFRTPPLDGSDAWLRDVTWRVTDRHEASCDDPYGPQLSCRETDGSWQIDFTLEDFDAQGNAVRESARGLDECIRDIGKAGISVDDIRRKLGSFTRIPGFPEPPTK
jgi:hypothetical protein